LQLNHAGLLIRRGFVHRGFLLHSDDRYFYKDSVVFPNDLASVRLMAVSEQDGEPMVHHFSFARQNTEHLKRKILLSGHFDDWLHPELGITPFMADPTEEAFIREIGVEQALQDDDVALTRKLPDVYRVVKPLVTFDHEQD
jgi:hypothetical protein